MSTTIGVDYSASTVYLGCLKDGKVAAVNTVDLKNLLMAMMEIRSLFVIYLDEFHSEKKVWIEEPWVNGSVFPKSGLMMTRTATILEIASMEIGFEPKFISPKSWRKKVYGNGSPNDPKETARRFVAEEFGYQTKFKNQHNICEAICIAHYGDLIASN